MNALLARASARFYLRHPWQLCLAIAGISLGVAVYVGVDLANDSARRAFELSAALVRGATTHRLLPVGGEMDETVYFDIARNSRIAAAPVLESNITIPALGDRRYTLLGIDPLAESGFRSFTAVAPGQDADLIRLITEPETVLLPEALLQSLDATVDSRLRIETAADFRTVTIVGTVSDANADPRTELPVVADISTAQELTGRYGTLSRIDLRLNAEQAAALQTNPPAGTVLVPAASEDAAFLELTRAFQTNIRALGLLALVVGMFLIYATMSFAVVQRQSALGVLRAIGTTRSELVQTVLLEAVILGVIGTTLGIVLGDRLATLLVDMVLRTIGDFFFSSAVAAVPPSLQIYLEGALLGLGASLVAALGPLSEAAGGKPIDAMQRSSTERRAQRRSRRAAAGALGLVIAASLLLAFETRSLFIAFTAIFFVLCAGALSTPFATSWLMKSLELAGRRFLGPEEALALRNVDANLSRTGVATAALAVAVATVIGIGLMITSFRSSLVQWLDTTLTADIYVSTTDAGDSGTLRRFDAITELPGVAGFSRTRFVELPTGRGPISLRATEPGPQGWGLDIVDGEVDSTLRRLAGGDSVAISEPMAFRFGLKRGDSIDLPTTYGSVSFEIAGVFRDYGVTSGGAVIGLETYRRLWNDASTTGIGIHLTEDANVTAVAGEIRRSLGLPAGTRLRTNQTIRALSMNIFDRTFQITEVLRVLAGIVAFLGILSAIMAIQLERAREFAVLRSLGFSPRRLAALILTETGLLGSAAALASIPIGLALAALLVYVINERSFGWTMEMIVRPQPILLGAAVAVGAAISAGLVPSLRILRGDLGAALRDE